MIEVLSPSNKKEPGRSEYLAKMEQLRHSGVHELEIDLLLAGECLTLEEPLPKGDFFAFLARKEKYPMSEVFAWSIRRKLPSLPVPLNSPDNDIVLDLASAFETTFKHRGYGRDLRYSVPFPGTLSAADREWAEAFVKIPRA